MATLSMVTGCGRSDAPREQAAAKTAADFFVIQVGDKPVKMQLAVKPREMERGLMERTDLKPDEGMLFVYLSPQQMSFWMRNTPTPLDIGFFTTDGTLKEVYAMQPHDETPVQSRSRELKFALEVNQGWFVKNEVKPGAKLDLKALSAALRARGIEPWEYGVR
ncbi:MAG: DUF192 domain-containing protein [Opitutaceae bacterium]|nr:DUF192 domain-containing protein [Opitutaceae bacterium]